VEVLYDHLLRLFQTHRDLSPSDVLVMMPNIREYAPFIKAVFDTPEGPRKKIPCTITDLPLAAETSVAETFLALVNLPTSRFDAFTVMSLLETVEVREAFGIEETDLPLLVKWVRACNIRWGLDASTLSDNGLSMASTENTWEAGINRLLLGYALPADNNRLFANIAGFDNIEGSGALLAGNLAEFVTAIADFTKQTREEHTPSLWANLLQSLLDRFFAQLPGSAGPIAALRAAIASLQEPETRKLYNGPIDLATVCCFLGGKIGTINAGAPFLGGPVTFCAMMPMRSIPFRVVCCIGMNDASFPRTSYHASWDLIAARPKPGDRSLEREDRYLFLEALISARERLYISYVGQSMRDNSHCRPSAVVEELLTYIDKGFCCGETSMRSQLTTIHPLQAWDRRYFEDNNRLFSFSAANAAIANAHAEQKPDAGRRNFCETALPAPAPEFNDVTVDSLIGFLKHPSKFFIKQRLAMTLEVQAEQLEETEAFALAGLERYGMAQELAKQVLRHPEGDADRYAVLRGQGKLPHANPGRYSFDALAGEVAAFVAPVNNFLSAEKPLPPIAIEHRFGDIVFHGAIDNLYAPGCVAYRCADAKPGDFLASWVRHCGLNAFGPADYPKTSLLFAKDGVWRMEPIDNALNELEKFLSLHVNGLTRPIHFFPKSSYAYADCVTLKNKTHEYGLKKAQETWNGSDWTTSECDDPYYKFCFGDNVVFGQEFTRLALDVWSPLFAHLKPFDAGSMTV
jgi:exodeoxyribonuclease V gamma subunit